MGVSCVIVSKMHYLTMTGLNLENANQTGFWRISKKRFMTNPRSNMLTNRYRACISDATNFSRDLVSKILDPGNSNARAKVSRLGLWLYIIF